MVRNANIPKSSAEPPKLKLHPINVFAVLYLWMLTIAGSIYLMLPLYTLLMCISVTLCNRIMGFLTITWFNTCNVKVLIYNCEDADDVDGVNERGVRKEKDSCLILMNHVGNLDWLHFYRVVMVLFNPNNYRIILKKELSKIPGAGSAMEMANFLFFTRKIDQDCDNIDRYLHYHKQNNIPIQLLMFCEGTFMNAASKMRSNKYAAKHGLPQYDYVLHPRTTGFKRILTQSASSLSTRADANGSNRKLFQKVYDITIGYKGFPASDDIQTVKGNLGNEFHFLVEKFEIDQIPIHDDEKLEQWLIERWNIKENTLSYFNQHGKFPHNPNSNKPIPLVKSTDKFLLIHLFQMGILTVVLTTGIYLALTNFYVCVYTIFAVCALVLMHKFNVQFNLYNR